MSGFSELVKNFGKTREYVRDFFIYGFKGRGDFAGKSLRTYDDEKRRAESWLAGYMTTEDSASGRSVAITVDSCHISGNPLHQAFAACSFTDNDIRLHFLLLDILSPDEAMSVREITEKMAEDYGAYFEEQTVRNKLREYDREGLVCAEKHGRSTCYRLAEDISGELFSRFPQLADALALFSVTGEFAEAGTALMRCFGLKNDHFIVKHNYIVNALEDELVLTITEALREKRRLDFDSVSSRDRDNVRHVNGAVPMAVYSSVRSGRRYLMAFDPEYDCYSAFRLDYMNGLKAGDVCEDYDRLKSDFDRQAGGVYGVSFGKGVRRPPMEITLRIDEENEDFVIQRLRREMRCGRLCRLEKDLYRLTIDATDPNEAMQWVKSFIGRIVSVKGGSDYSTGRFLDDVKRMAEMYGGEQT